MTADDPSGRASDLPPREAAYGEPQAVAVGTPLRFPDFDLALVDKRGGDGRTPLAWTFEAKRGAERVAVHRGALDIEEVEPFTLGGMVYELAMRSACARPLVVAREGGIVPLVRFDLDYDEIPLWDGQGHQYSEDDLLLTADLWRDLKAWGREFGWPDDQPNDPDLAEAMRRRGRDLFERVRDELVPTYEVVWDWG